MDLNQDPDLPPAVASALRARPRLAWSEADLTRFEARLLERFRARPHRRPAWAAAMTATAASLLVGLWLAGRPRPPAGASSLAADLAVAENLELYESLEVIEALDRLQAPNAAR